MSPVPGILQARTLEWVAISFSNAWKWKVKVKSLSHVWLLATPWLQPTRLLHPWDFPAKSTGVGCHWFCYTLTWICHGCTRVPNPKPSSHHPPNTIPLDHPCVPAPSILYPASNLDWQFISYMILYMFQCHSPKSSHPLSLPQSPKDWSIHLCLFCCLAYRGIVTIFLFFFFFFDILNQV